MAGFDNYDTGGFYDEMFLPDGSPRPEAALLARLISSLPDGEMNRRQQAAERALLHMGITFNVYGDKAAGYGKPILDRTLHYQDPMRFAPKVGCLAFDSTRISAVNVDFPLDVVLYARDSHRIV